MLTATNLTIAQIETLRIEAGQAGDKAMIKACERAAEGSMRARRIVARRIRENAARAAE